MSTSVAAPLVPDAAVRFRDALLDPAAFAEAVAGSRDLPDVTACRLIRARYQPGRSLRVVHELELGPRRLLLAARTPRKPLTGPAGDGAFPLAVLGSVVWTYPNDRKVRGIARLEATIREALGRDDVVTELVGWAPEKSVSVRCHDGSVTVAYAKAHAAGATAAREWSAHRELRAQLTDAAPLAVPRALALRDNVLVVEPAAGRPLGEQGDAAAYARYARGLAHLHSLRPPAGAPAFERLAPERLVAAAGLIGGVRPDAGDAAHELARTLLGRQPADARRACLHGDAHPKNALDDGGRVAVIDLEQTAVGDPAAELGSVLAAIRYRVVTGEVPDDTAELWRHAILGAYAESGDLPPPAALAWNTAAALLAERAQRAVTRVRNEGLRRLPALLQHARELLQANA